MRMLYVIPVLVILPATALSSVFTVDEREKVLVLQFGEIKQVIDQPGLYVKVPFIQDILRYDDRILGLTTEPQEFTLGDQRPSGGRCLCPLAHRRSAEVPPRRGVGRD